MPAFLALIPVKDWVYAGLILTLLAGFGAYTIHERHVGEVKVEAANAKTAAAQIVHNTEVESRAKILNASAMQKYLDTVAVAPVDSPHVLVRYLTIPQHVPALGADPVGAAPEAAQPVQDQVDIGPPLDAIGRDDDALITALQARVLSDAQVCGVKP